MMMMMMMLVMMLNGSQCFERVRDRDPEREREKDVCVCVCVFLMNRTFFLLQWTLKMKFFGSILGCGEEFCAFEKN